MLDAFGQGMYSLDIERVLRVLTEDALVIGSEVGELGFGHDAIRTFIKRVMDRYGPIKWEWDLVEIRGAGDHAWFFVEGNVSYSGELSPYRASGVCRRDDVGEWKLAMFHGSTPDGD